MANSAPAPERAPYRERHYLLFGMDADVAYSLLDCDDAADYLHDCGFSGGSLTQARCRCGQYERFAGYRDPSAHYCDFCSRALAGGEYDVLKDGRERCIECAQTVVRRQADFEALLAQTREGLCLKYNIELDAPIRVRVVSQARISKEQGSKYVPTKYFDARAVGFARSKRDGDYEMFFENGAPKASLTATCAHELTHIWQYMHWDWEGMKATYSDYFLAVCEGMAKWSEIQYLYLLNETGYADRRLANEVARKDVYGYGLRMFLNAYPITKDIVLAGPTPFSDPNNPIDVLGS